MEDHHQQQQQQQQETKAASKGCGMLDFLKKKHDEKPPENADVTNPEPMKETKEDETEKEKPSLAEKLHRSDSSSSDEEEGGKGEKKEKKKKKVSGNGKEDSEGREEGKAGEKKEKKGIMEKIKEKLPGGQHGKVEHDEKDKDEKGLMEKIKEKLPGHHRKEDEKKKET